MKRRIQGRKAEVELTNRDPLKLILSEPFGSMNDGERISSEGFTWVEGEDVDEVVR